MAQRTHLIFKDKFPSKRVPEKSEIQNHLELHSKLEASLEYNEAFWNRKPKEEFSWRKHMLRGRQSCHDLNLPLSCPVHNHIVFLLGLWLSTFMLLQQNP